MLGPATKSSAKRKLSDVESDDQAYQDPRHSILTISMCKLKTCPVRRVEPSLRRSVLIFNTLKIIERELQREGLPIMPTDSTLSLPAMDTEDLTLDILPDVGSSGLPDQRSSHCLNLTSRDEDSKVHEKDSPSPIVEVATYTSLGSASAYQPLEAVQTVGLNELTDSLARQTVSDLITSAHSLMPFTSMSSLSPKHDDLRSEIDMAFGDFDILSAFPQSSKLPPLSAEEIVHSFTSHNCGLPDSYPTISNTQCCKSDIICEDFDNIMQILVGM
ncbi:uncharacterized protein LOC135469077 [Liolophura sinensis]|uniref:uncharacterized protein LOC135469077 n=1 Tax=Liolophura sinensis TaxID=3198878 RepID=UPI0031589A40